MRRLLWLLTLGALAVALTACPRKAEEEAATETAPAEETSLPGANVRVGLAFDAGGKFDRSFNQSAWEGAQRAAQERFDLVIGVGFANEPAITATAKEFPNVKFAVIDAVPGEGQLPNALGVVFREHEGSFLVGYVAGKLSRTGVVGFIGGMDIPLIHKFEAGFRAGAEYAFQEDGIQGRVLVGYVGNTPAAWNDPAKAKELSTAMSANSRTCSASASTRARNSSISEGFCVRFGMVSSRSSRPGVAPSRRG